MPLCHTFRVRCKFQKRGLLKAVEAFLVKSRYPVFLALFEVAESENDRYLAELLIFSLLIVIFWVILAIYLSVDLYYVSFFQISVRAWHMWYQIQALNFGSSLMCSVGSFCDCCGNGSQELIKNRGKMVSFLICVKLKCDLAPNNTSKGISMVIKNFLALFLIDSCQFHMTKIFWA